MKKQIVLGTLCFVLAVSAASNAQTLTNSDVPDKAQILQFLDLMHAKAQMIQAMEGMAKQMRIGAEQRFKDQVPGATPEQLAKVDAMFDGLFKDLPIDEMVDAIVPIYQKHLTKSDLAAVTAFYSSPAGQKILKEMPAIMAEGMQAGGEIGRRVFEEKAHKLDEQVAELAKEAKEMKKN